MEGFEEDWNEVDSTRRFATYTNLDPGDLCLQGHRFQQRWGLERRRGLDSHHRDPAVVGNRLGSEGRMVVLVVGLVLWRLSLAGECH